MILALGQLHAMIMTISLRSLDMDRVARLSPVSESWCVSIYMNREDSPIPSEIRYSYWAFNRTYYCDHSYLERHAFYYHNGEIWKRYIAEDYVSISRSYPIWITPYGNELIFGVYEYGREHIWITRGDRAVKMVHCGVNEPSCVTYSPVMQAIYGLTYTDGSYFISVYKFEVISLFNQCAKIIQKSEMIDQVPLCLKRPSDEPRNRAISRTNANLRSGISQYHTDRCRQEGILSKL